MNETRIAELKKTINATWAEVLKNSKAAELIQSGDIDKRFYALYLIETYQYTFHNSRNQALAGVRVDNRNVQYMKYCYRHAYEEVGHELMALHDLRELGIDTPIENFPQPLPETQTLIAYLYHVSTTGNPVQRLGYSAWAEDSYEQFGQFLQLIQKRLELSRSQMSFFVEHAGLDEKHADQVARALTIAAKCFQDWEDIASVAETSLRLAGRMLDAVADEYLRLKAGKPSRYDFLNTLN